MRPFRTALAVASACAIQLSIAQTPDPVTLYGSVYVTTESVEAKGGSSPVERRLRVSDQASRLGIRGSENLGGSLKAFFQLETGFKPDSNTGSFAQRNSAIGLEGKWGSIRAGRWDTPFKQTQASFVDPWSDLQIGDITGAALRQGGFSRRAENTIQYWSPKFANVQLKTMYGVNEGRTAAANPYLHSAALVYSRGANALAYAYEKHHDSNGSSTTAGVDEEGFGLSGKWTFGMVKLSGQYGEYRRTNATKQKSYQAGVQLLLSRHTLILTYSASKDGGATGSEQPRCDLTAFGYKYTFSKQTFLIASYATVKNDVGRLCNFGSNSLSIADRQDPEGFSIGLRKAF